MNILHEYFKENSWQFFKLSTFYSFASFQKIYNCNNFNINIFAVTSIKNILYQKKLKIFENKRRMDADITIASEIIIANVFVYA